MNESEGILICMGSSCFSRGNQRNLKIIEAFLAERGAAIPVTVTGSRCEGYCPEGPNLAINGTLYHHVDEGTLFDLLEAHFGGGKE